MALDYLVKINRGVESLGTGESLSVKEDVKRTLSRKELTRLVIARNHLLGGGIADMAYEAFCQVAAEYMALGYRVPLYLMDGTMFATMRADLSLNHPITLEEVQKEHPEVTTFTEENASDFISFRDFNVTAKMEPEPICYQMIQQEVEHYNKVGTIEVGYKAKKRKNKK